MGPTKKVTATTAGSRKGVPLRLAELITLPLEESCGSGTKTDTTGRDGRDHHGEKSTSVQDSLL